MIAEEGWKHVLFPLLVTHIRRRSSCDYLSSWFLKWAGLAMGSGGHVGCGGSMAYMGRTGLNEVSGPLCRSAGGKATAVRPSDPHCVAEGGNTPPCLCLLNN